MSLRVVRGADERPRLDMVEAEGPAGLREVGELFRPVVPGNGQMSGGGPQILSQREDVDVDEPQIPHGVEQLLTLFTQAEDDPGFRQQAGRPLTGAPEELERPLVAPAMPRDLARSHQA